MEEINFEFIPIEQKFIPHVMSFPECVAFCKIYHDRKECSEKTQKHNVLKLMKFVSEGSVSISNDIFNKHPIFTFYILGSYEFSDYKINYLISVIANIVKVKVSEDLINKIKLRHWDLLYSIITKTRETSHNPSLKMCFLDKKIDIKITNINCPGIIADSKFVQKIIKLYNFTRRYNII